MPAPIVGDYIVGGVRKFLEALNSSGGTAIEQLSPRTRVRSWSMRRTACRSIAVTPIAVTVYGSRITVTVYEIGDCKIGQLA
jgi:hypothetical protein